MDLDWWSKIQEWLLPPWPPRQGLVRALGRYAWGSLRWAVVFVLVGWWLGGRFPEQTNGLRAWFGEAVPHLTVGLLGLAAWVGGGLAYAAMDAERRSKA